MANNLSVKIGANTADLERNLEKAKQTLERYSNTAKQAKSQIEQNVSVSNQQVNAYQRVVRQLEKVNSGTLSSTQQQKVLTNQVKELKIQWNSLTDDQRVSGWGQQIASSLKAAESELDTVKGKLAAVSDETKKTSETTESYSNSSFNLSGVMSKLGLAFGAAEAATYAFNEILKTSQSLGDQWEATVSGMKTALDSFWYSLANMDFTGFIEGFNAAYAAGKRAAEIRDTLATYSGNASVQESQWNAVMTETEAVLRDSTASLDQKREATKRANEATEEYKNTLDAEYQISVRSMNADLRLYDVYRKNASGANLSGQELNKLTDVYAKHSSIIEGKLIPQWEAADSFLFGSAKQREEVVNTYAKQLGITQDQVLALITLYQKMDDKAKESFNNQLKSAIQYQEGIAAADKRLNRAEGRVNNTTTKTPKVTIPKTPKKTKKQIIQEKVTFDWSGARTSLDEYNKYLKDEQEKRQKEQEKIQEDWNKQQERNDEEAAKRRYKADKKAREDKRKQDEEDQKKEEERQKTKIDGIHGIMNATSALMAQSAQMAGQDTAEGKALMAMSRMIIIAQQAEALAKGVASAAGQPFPYNLAAIASVIGAITSIFANLPTFADGGIFNGSSKIGDYNVARVNDGEMILNGRQQANLFRLFDSGNINTSTIAVQNPEVRIKGSDIYLSQKNYKNITGRKL